MHLISVTVRNYRIHRELTLHFDRARTLIGGANEVGKSTLIEAIHRGLFFPARSGAEPQKRMRSSLHPGNPEVELALESGGCIYHLRKRFSPTNGTTTLTAAGREPMHGARAEEQLAQLLRVPGDLSAKAAIECWAHLWVWQGVSGDNPGAVATSQCDALLARLQSSGGAGAMQSDRDRRVAAHFEALVDQNLTQAGRAKAGSELAVAESESQAAALACQEAAERVARLRQAVSDMEQAGRTLAAAERDLVSLLAEHVAVSEKQVRATALQQRLEKEVRVANEATSRYDALFKAHGRITDLERELASLRESLAPVQTELADRDAARLERLRLAEAAESDAQLAAEKVRGVHLRRELAATHALVLEKRNEQHELSERLAHTRAVEQELSTQRLRLAELPEINATRVRQLQQMESECATAQASVAAMAAGVEVVAADLAVSIGGQPVATGETHIVTDDTEVLIGRGTRLRIRPGGGRSLSEARTALGAARRRLQQALDGYGLASVAAAVETAARREAHAALVEAGQTRLADFKLPSLAAKVNELGEVLSAAEARIARLRIEVPDATTPVDLAGARLAATELERELRDVETAERRARVSSEAARKSLGEAEKTYDKQREICDQRGRLVTGGVAQLKLLVEVHGDPVARAQATALAVSACEGANQAARLTQEALAALQPELLPGAAARLQRAIEEKRRTIHESDTSRAVARTLLSSDGTRDPHAELAQCEARRRFATERLAAARRRVAAFKLLHDLFCEEQHRLAEQFTRPLADKVSRYLQCVFGAGARFVLSLHESTFSELQLVRADDGQGAVSFESLSGGTREQVAAAVRLAMAELLAADYDGCLPVVFDDAFAYSDSHRANILQGMLDLAAARGLQVIVLTCNPTDYASLGARELQIPNQPRTQMAVHSPGAVPAQGASEVFPNHTVAPARMAEAHGELLRTVLRSVGGTKQK